MWPTLFTLTNAIALIAWLPLIFAPRRPLILSAVLYAGVGLLCLIYTALMVSMLAGWADPLRDAGAPALAYSVRGLRAFFMSDGGIVVGWAHYLALDLFTGLWIARDGDQKGISRLVQAPILFATYMAGPLGLLIWLATREPAARRSSKEARAR